MSAFRLAILAALIAVGTWLVLDSSPNARRVDRLNRMILNGGLQQLTADQAEELQKTLRWLARSAGSTEDIRLNMPYSADASRSGALHVYVTRPEYAALTGCAANNALYSGDLDLICIDRSFVALDEWRQYLAAPDGGWGLDIPFAPADIPSIKVLLRFVLLHEMGHRQLHGPKAPNRTSRRTQPQQAIEDEADRFAIERMRIAFQTAADFGLIAVEPNMGSIIGFSVTADTPAADQVQAALVEMAKVVLGAQFVLPSANSPFLAGSTHPNLITRLVNLMSIAGDTYQGSPDLQAITRYERKRTDSYVAVARRGPLEISSRAPLLHLTWSDKGLLIATTDRTTVSRIGSGELQRDHGRGASLPVSEADRIWQGTSTGKHKPAPIVWSATDGSIILPAAATRIRPDGGIEPWTIQPVQLDGSDLMLADKGVKLGAFVQPDLPSAFFVSTAAADDRTWLLVIAPDGKVRSVSLSRLNEQIEAKGASVAALHVSGAVFAEDGVYLPLIDRVAGEKRFRGYAFLSIANLDIERLILPRIPDSFTRYSTVDNPLLDEDYGLRRFAIRRTRTGETVYLVSLDSPGSSGSASDASGMLEVWSFDEKRDPLKLAQLALPLFAIRSSGISAEKLAQMYLSPRLKALYGDHVGVPDLLISVESDASYRFRLSDNALEPIFPAGGDTVQLLRGNDGAVYAQGLNGYKIYRVPD